MHDIFYFVDTSAPGLSGRDLLRLARLQTQRTPSREEQTRKDIGTDRRKS